MEQAISKQVWFFLNLNIMDFVIAPLIKYSIFKLVWFVMDSISWDCHPQNKKVC